MFSQQTSVKISFVYNLTTQKWKQYLASDLLNERDYLISEPDSNNNVSIYTSTFSPLQELNILKYGKMYVINEGLYVYNSDKLSISKVSYNGKIFVRNDMNQNEIAKIFPDYTVLNIDSYSNYNVLAEKDSQKGKYILISRYGQGWNEYKFSAIRGTYEAGVLPNMMSINSLNDVVVAFHHMDVNPEGTSDTYPTYRLVYHTNGQPNYDEQEGITNFDEQTANEEEHSIDEHEANMMPKIDNESSEEENIEEQNEEVANPPQQELEPPTEE